MVSSEVAGFCMYIEGRSNKFWCQVGYRVEKKAQDYAKGFDVSFNNEIAIY